ncbi:MAG TPA: cell division protein FtsZ, partial [Opitutaceae bacterium]|nr:cell division protein FtsZ [Opitutaceae bacterium]
DEECQNRLEVCVLGTSDMGGRGAVLRRSAARSRPLPVKEAAPEDPAGPSAAPAKSAAPAAEKLAPALAAKAVHQAKAAQDEFGFGEVESRGHFEKTDRNLFDGQDLDVPTYLRKGIRIAL